ncbi:hypothetical protein BH23GEM11_BH23GEM11_05870 [soil metagenome]
MPDRFAGSRLRACSIAVLGAAVLLSGCGLRSSAGGELAAPTDHAADPSASVAAAESSGESSTRYEKPPTEMLLEQGHALLVAGRYEEAVAAFETYLVFGEQPDHRRSATWSLALVYLLPTSPLRSQPRALALLDSLAEAHPGSLEAIQAGWIRTVLQESARNRSALQEHERTIRDLNVLVEQLKQIDLNRRPPGGGESEGG